MSKTRVVLVNPAAKHYKSKSLDERELVLQEEQPEEEMFTEISISTESSAVEALQEVKTVWKIHSHAGAPIAFFCNNQLLSLLLAEAFPSAAVLTEDPSL